MEQTASTLAFDHAPERRQVRRPGRAAREEAAQLVSDERAAGPSQGSASAREGLEPAPLGTSPLPAAAPRRSPTGTPGLPPARAAAEDTLERDVQQASLTYTGRMLWAACLFIAGAVVLTHVERVGPGAGAFALACLLCAILLQYQARRRLREALIVRAEAKGTSRAAARAGADATLDRISR